MSVEKCTSCGTVSLSEADLHEVVGALDTEDAPTDWAPTEETDRTVLDSLPQVASPDEPTAVGTLVPDLPFNVESRPPPPRRVATPAPAAEFSAPPMLTEDFKLPPGFGEAERTEEAPKLTMPVHAASMSGDVQVNLSGLREAAAPPPREAGPGPASDFNDEPTRPAYPLEGTLEPADEVDSYLVMQEDRRRTRTFVLIAVAALMVIGGVGTVGYLQYAPQAGAAVDAAGLSDVISSSDGRVAVEVSEPSLSELLPPEPIRTPPKPEVEIRVSRTAPKVGPVQVVRAPVPVVVPVVAPVSAPSPSVAAAAPVPRVSGFSALVKKGWSSVSANPTEAVEAFSSALRSRPGDPEASYGLGYSLWRLDRQAEALPHLCLALRAGDVDTQREVNGMLARSDLSCD